MTLSVRERVMQQLQANLNGMATPTYTFAWNIVSRKPLERFQEILGNAVSAIDIGASRIYEAGYILVGLRVAVEFWYAVEEGAEPSTELNRMLLDVQKEIMRDHYLTETGTGIQLAKNVRLLDDSFDLDGPRDGFVSCTQFIEVTYRHGKQDPSVVV